MYYFSYESGQFGEATIAQEDKIAVRIADAISEQFNVDCSAVRGSSHPLRSDIKVLDTDGYNGNDSGSPDVHDFIESIWLDIATDIVD